MAKTTEKRVQDDRLQVRCTAEEKALLQRAADADHRNLSNFVLASALERAREILREG